MKKILLSLFFITRCFCSEVADIVVCSFNRPMQLYCLLESIETRIVGYGNIFVICRSDEKYRAGYKIVKKDFPNIQFFYQPNGDNCRRSFQPMFLDLVYNKDHSDSEYVVFSGDDIIIMDDIDLKR